MRQSCCWAPTFLVNVPFIRFVHDDPAMAQASVHFQSFARAGSIVNISFQRQGVGAIEVSLKRACTTDLADRRSLACRLPPATVLDFTVTWRTCSTWTSELAQHACNEHMCALNRHDCESKRFTFAPFLCLVFMWRQEDVLLLYTNQGLGPASLNAPCLGP
jgi:hypothetical protein